MTTHTILGIIMMVLWIIFFSNRIYENYKENSPVSKRDIFWVIFWASLFIFSLYGHYFI